MASWIWVSKVRYPVTAMVQRCPQPQICEQHRSNRPDKNAMPIISGERPVDCTIILFVVLKVFFRLVLLKYHQRHPPRTHPQLPSTWILGSVEASNAKRVPHHPDCQPQGKCKMTCKSLLPMISSTIRFLLAHSGEWSAALIVSAACKSPRNLSLYP